MGNGVEIHAHSSYFEFQSYLLLALFTYQYIQVIYSSIQMGAALRNDYEYEVMIKI
jgi:hypothetical protein